ncbi:MAG TPA: hypothetical protein VF875_02840 [Anaeromyxobacter sp.]
MRQAAQVVALAALVALAGCKHLQRQPDPQTTEGEWAKARDRATRRALLYDGLNHRATVTATLLTPAVREARARRLGEWLGWTQAELDARLAQERNEAAEGEELFLSFYTSDPHENDLDAVRPVWRVAVKLDDTDVVARRMTGVDRDANTLSLFPYVGPFDVVYRVLFPPAPGGSLADREFRVEVASGEGRLSLDFRGEGGPMLKQSPVPPP